jgi:hypothetical protein
LQRIDDELTSGQEAIRNNIKLVGNTDLKPGLLVLREIDQSSQMRLKRSEGSKRTLRRGLKHTKKKTSSVDLNFNTENAE